MSNVTIGSFSFPKNTPPPFYPEFHASIRKIFISALPYNSAVVIIGNKEHIRNGYDNYSLFRQNSNFSHLTGFEEPDSVAILSNKSPRFTLIVPPKDPDKEVWTGIRAGQEGAVNQYGADEAYPREKLGEVLEKVRNTVSQIFVISDKNNPELTQEVLSQIGINSTSLENPFTIPKEMDKSTLLYRIRMVKTPYEIALMQRAVDISGEGHKRAMQRAKKRNNPTEKMIQGVVEHVFTSKGAAGPGYPSIVASGKNATTLHYELNQAVINGGDLVLIDAGAEYGGYTADITRTWPINGKFTPQQKEIYTLVLNTQKEVISKVKPGVTIKQLHELSVRLITEGLVEIGLLKGKVEELVEQKAYTKYYMHCISHFLGRDVHDAHTAESYEKSKEIPLQPGMVITVEPGIYVREVDHEEMEPYLNIGARIEDNILVTDNGCFNFSRKLPREIDEIENLMK